VRLSKGADIAAACGQLAGRFLEKPVPHTTPPTTPRTTPPAPPTPARRKP